MRKFPKESLWHAAACLTCTAVLWIHLDDFGASDFSGGLVARPVFRMCAFGSLLFLLVALLTTFLRRTAATIALAATLLSLPLYLYVLMPGPYRRIFKGEYSTPLRGSLRWDNWAVIGVLSLLFVATLSLRTYSKQSVPIAALPAGRRSSSPVTPLHRRQQFEI